MEIKSRRQAIADGDNIFFTGKLCVNGHLTYRYVTSGTCKECVNAPRSENHFRTKAQDLRNRAAKLLLEAESLDSLAVNVASDNIKRESLIAADKEAMYKYYETVGQFVIFKEFIHPQDIDAAVEILLALATKRSPLVRRENILSRGFKPKAGGLFKLRCHPDDLEEAKEAIVTLRKSHGVVDLKVIEQRLGVNYISPPPVSTATQREEVVSSQYQEFGVKCSPSHLDLLTSLVQYYAMARYGSDINLDEFVPQAQGGAVADMYWIKCDAEDLPAIKQALT